MIFLVILLSFLLLISIHLSKSSVGRFFLAIITFSILFMSCGFVTYTRDYEFYEWFYYEDVPKDYIFNLIRVFFRSNNFSFKSFNIFYNFLNCFLIVYFISYFKKNTLVIGLIFYLFLYLFFTTQLRYFLAYPLALIALYQFFVKKRNVLAIGIFILSALSHSGIIIILPVVFMIDIEKMKLSKFFLISILFNVLIYLLFFVISTALVGGYNAYLVLEGISSFQGGVFYFFIFTLDIIILKYWISKHQHLIEEKDKAVFTFLLKMAVFPFFYLFMAIFIQVIGHRFIVPGLLFQIITYFFMIGKIPRNKVRVSNVVFFMVLLFNFFYIYVLPTFFMKDDTIETIYKMLLSNPIFSYFYE